MALEDYIRRRNLFDPVQQPSMNLNLSKLDWSNMGRTGADSLGVTNPADSDTDDQGNDYGVASVYDKLLKAGPAQASKRYQDFLAQQTPDRSQYKPGKMDRIAAVLSGISEGGTKGGTTGYKAARDVLDTKYNQAMSDWKLQGDKLAKAADIEEKDIGNRVKTYRDIVTDMQNQRNASRQGRLTDAQIKDYQSKAEDRKAQAATRGFHYINEPTSGNVFGVRPDITAPGGIQKLDFGVQGALNPAQAAGAAGTRAGAVANAQFPTAEKLAHIRAQETRQTNAARPKLSLVAVPNGNYIIIDQNNNTVQDTGYSTGKQGDKEKAEQKLNDAITLRQTPGVDKESVTNLDITNPDKPTKTVKTTEKPSAAPIRRPGPIATASIEKIHYVRLSPGKDGTPGRKVPIPESQMGEAWRRDPGLHDAGYVMPTWWNEK